MLDAQSIDRNTVIDEKLGNEGSAFWRAHMMPRVGMTVGEAIKQVSQDSQLGKDLASYLARVLADEIESINQMRAEKTLRALLARDAEHRDFHLRSYCRLCEHKGWSYDGWSFTDGCGMLSVFRWRGAGWYAPRQQNDVVYFSFLSSERKDGEVCRMARAEFLGTPQWYDEPPLDANVDFVR